MKLGSRSVHGPLFFLHWGFLIAPFPIISISVGCKQEHHFMHFMNKPAIALTTDKILNITSISYLSSTHQLKKISVLALAIRTNIGYWIGCKMWYRYSLILLRTALFILLFFSHFCYFCIAARKRLITIAFSNELTTVASLLVNSVPNRGLITSSMLYFSLFVTSFTSNLTDYLSLGLSS